MNDLDRAMLHIMDLGDASIDFSEYTGKWYVSQKVHIGDDTFLTVITVHVATPERAVFVYLARLQAVEYPRYLVTNTSDPAKRKHWRWNDIRERFSEVAP